MNGDLFKALLAMDSYNRSYGSLIDLNIYDENGNLVSIPNKIGFATIQSDSQVLGTTVINGNPIRLDESIGFYAIAYNYSGEKIISFRGTDDPWGLVSGGDIVNGWIAGAGLPGSNQAELAFQFYKSVAGTGVDPRTANISLTGHSLGGGLAGLVGATYGKSGILFDNMPFELAAGNTRAYSDPVIAAAEGKVYNSALRALVYGLSTAATWVPNFSGLKTEYVQGEILTPLRALQNDVSKTPINLGTNVSLPDSLGVDEHSMASLIIGKYATTNVNGTDWQAVAQYFWPVLYDNSFATGFGNFATTPGILRDQQKYSDIVRMAVAYSAINEGERPFGDTGIRALYDDANQLGKVLAAGAGASQMLVSHATDISKAFVQFAGTLALNQVLQRNIPVAVRGVLDHSEANKTLTVDFTDRLWMSVNKNAMPNMIARADLVAGLYEDIGNAQSIRNATKLHWGDDTTNVIERVVFATGESGASVIANSAVPTNKGTLFIGGSGIDTVTGSIGNDMFYGGAGNDTINGGAGDDIFLDSEGVDTLNGGVGIDTVDYSNRTTGVLVNLATGTARAGFELLDNLRDIEHVTLTSFDDYVTLNSAGSGRVWDGKGGNDTIVYQSFAVLDNRGPETLVWDQWALWHDVIRNFENIRGMPFDAQNPYVTMTLLPNLNQSGFVAPGINSVDYSSSRSSAKFDFPTGGQGYGQAVIGGVTQDLQFYSSGNPGSLVPPNHIGHLYGTNHGDTYSITWAGSAPGHIHTGSGNDVVTLFSAAGSPYTIYYRGGNDTYHLTEQVREIRLDPSIILSDISIISASTNGGPDFHAVLNIAGFGTLTLDYNGMYPDGVAVVLESGGRIGFSSGSSAYTITGTSTVQTTLNGTWGDDVLSGRTGYAQTYYALGGDDIVRGNDGNDTLHGGEGNDKLYGGEENDLLFGNSGNDLLEGGNGNDNIYGGEGNDTLDAATGTNKLYGEAGNDTYKLAANSSNMIDDTAGVNILSVALTRPEVLFTLSGNYMELYNSSRSFYASLSDYRSFSGITFSNGVTVAMKDFIPPPPPLGTPTSGGDNIDASLSLSAVSINLLGGSDVFYGSQYNDTVWGGSDNDYLRGGGGDDTLYGDAGNDELAGGDGINTLYGGSGNDAYVLNKVSVNMIDDAEGINNIILSGINLPDLLKTVNGSELQIYNASLGFFTTISNHAGIETITFGNGQVSSMADFLAGVAPSPYNPTSSNNYVNASSAMSGVTINLLSGDDTFRGSSFNDTVFGSNGNDSLFGNLGSDMLQGGAGDDQILGSDFPDRYKVNSGLADNDTIDGGTGVDWLEGVWGDDTYVFRVGDSPLSNPDYVSEYVGQGIDTIKLTGGIRPQDVTFYKKPNWGDGTFWLKYSPTDEIMLLSSRVIGDQWSENVDELTVEKVAFDDGTVLNLADLLNTPPANPYPTTTGNDTINASAASAAVTINLLAGNDIFTGSNYNDNVSGGDGNDIIEGKGGNDILKGDAGTDTVTYASSAAAVTVNLATTAAQNTVGAGTDTISTFENLTGSAFNDTLTGDSGENVIDGGAGNDTIQGGAGNDVLIGGAGTDRVTFAAATAAVTVSLATTAAQNTVGAGTDTISGFENLTGSNYNDTLTGDAGANVIDGGSGNDIIQGGAGNDTLIGGAGTDTLTYASATAGVTVNLGTTAAQNTGGAGTDTISAFENLTGSGYNDTLTGSSGNNTIKGGAGNDTIQGGAGNDILDGEAGTDTVTYAASTAAVTVNLATTTSQATGGAGSDTITNFENLTGSGYSDTLRGNTGNNTLSGGNGNDTLYGNSGNDILYGDAGTDTLYGDAGNDTLNGGASNDILYGGTGSDIFKFSPGGGIDTVKDFKKTEVDKLDIKDLLTGYDPATKAITDFIQITTSGTSSIVKIDANGLTGGTAWTQIATLENITGLTDEAALKAAGTIIA